MKNHIYTFMALLIVCGIILPANAQRSFRYRFHYNHTHDTMVYSKSKHYNKYKITKTGANTGIYNDWYKKQGGPLSEIHYEIVNGKIEHRREKVFTRSRKLETYTVYDSVQPYNIKSFKRTEYFESGKPKIVFSQKNDLLQGYYVEYNDNGKTREQGNYEAGFKTGIWKEYYRRGPLKAMGGHINQKTVITCDPAKYGHYLLTVTNSFTGRKTSFDIGSLNCRVFDSLDTKYHLMKDGNISFPFTYHHKQGEWVYFNEAGDTTSTEYYENGELAQPQKMAQFVGGYDSLKTYLKRTIKNPIAPGQAELNGRVYVRFTINAKGEFENIDVEERWNENVRTEAARIVAQMPAWEPALLYGKPVPCNYTLCLVYQPGQTTNNPASILANNSAPILLAPTEGVQWARNYGDAVVDGDEIETLREEGERVYPYTITATDGSSAQSWSYSDAFVKTVAKKEGKGSEYVVPIAKVKLATDGVDYTEAEEVYEGPGSVEELVNDLPVIAGNKVLNFHVVDTLTNEQLPFARIELKENKNTVATATCDINGECSIKHTFTGNYKIVVSLTGYKKREFPFVWKASSPEKHSFSIILQPLNQDIQPNGYIVPLIDTDGGRANE